MCAHEQWVELINIYFLKVNMGNMKVAWEPGTREWKGAGVVA